MRFVRPGRALIPGETLVALVVASPLLAVLLSRNVVHGDWSTRLQVVIGVVAYASAIALCLHGVFNGIFARLQGLAQGGSVRFPVYWVAAVAVVAAVSRAFVPVFAWMAVSFDPTRRIVQGSVVVTFYLAAAFLFKRATQRIADEQGRALKERAAALDARFQALQARTNPHFLFNALNGIMSLIGSDARKAEHLLGRLSTLLRYAIEGAERSHVSLREELDAVRDYLEIEQARFGDRLHVTLEVADDVDLAVRVPPMVLQPLVENAIVHAVARSVGGGRVLVAATNRADHLVELIVDDEGAPADASPHLGTKTGLSNLRERLRILYDHGASLTAGPRPNGGFRARVTIPSRSPT